MILLNVLFCPIISYILLFWACVTDWRFYFDAVCVIWNFCLNCTQRGSQFTQIFFHSIFLRFSFFLFANLPLKTAWLYVEGSRNMEGYLRWCKKFLLSHTKKKKQKCMFWLCVAFFFLCIFIFVSFRKSSHIILCVSLQHSFIYLWHIKGKRMMMSKSQLGITCRYMNKHEIIQLSTKNYLKCVLELSGRKRMKKNFERKGTECWEEWRNFFHCLSFSFEMCVHTMCIVHTSHSIMQFVVVNSE